jgi:hypothetical protein
VIPGRRSRRRAAHAVAGVTLLLGLAACGADRIASELDARTGRMTREEAARRYGPPTHVMAIAGQEVWSYEERAVVGALPAPASPEAAPGPFVGRTVRRQILLYFDARGVLTHWDRF